ncbi:hypothetical protein UFOVP616_21 [uncultured Caudovirales phage]|uniref:Uncharacterized protein n=1 Tax=uncultured Caudovirales phage TaxID=2100421 RepID=A0A6J5N5S5_9CAUD|nr:hypothetical protein UFOVP616_21 [uncultured Caudovirales phage]
MAIEPYQRKIGVPDSAGGGMTRIADTRSFDLGPAISSLSDTLQETFAPILADEAIKRATEEAGSVVFMHDPKTNELLLPVLSKEGGTIRQAAYEKLLTANYINEVGTASQERFDQRAADARTGVKPYNAQLFNDDIDAMVEGTLSGVDPRVRLQLSEVLNREALERKRAFTAEVSGAQRRSTLEGTSQKIARLWEKSNTFRNDGISEEEAEKTIIAPLKELAKEMIKYGAMMPAEAEAMALRINDTNEGFKRYYESIITATDHTAAMVGVPDEDLQTYIDFAEGIGVGKTISGKYRKPLDTPALVTPESLGAYYKQKYGVTPSSGARAIDDPLTKKNKGSYHNIANGGRAIDVPAVPGMTFDQWVRGFKDDKFVVLEARDEYKKPSKHATGPHWHIAVGNKRAVTVEKELPATQGFTREEFMKLDPSVQNLLGKRANEEQNRRASVAVENRRLEAEAAREAREAARLQAIAAEIKANTTNGISNLGLTGPAKVAMSEAFRAAIDVSKLNDPQERKKASAFISANGYVDESIFNYLDANIRGKNFEPAMDLYNALKTTTLGPSGARVGDLILKELDPSTRSLLVFSDQMQRSGITGPVMRQALEAARSGDVYQTPQAIEQYNIQRTDKTRGYKEDKADRIKAAFNVQAGIIIPKTLSDDFDAAYTAMLEITNSPAKAMEMAAPQLNGRYKASGLFKGNIGPSSLLNTYPADLIKNFLFDSKRPDGSPLIRRVPGQLHRIYGYATGNKAPTIKIQSIDSNTSGIGRYSITVYEPNNPSNVIDFIPDVHLGIEMKKYAAKKRQQNPATQTTVDPVAEARKKRAGQVDFMRKIGEGGDRGPKY